MGKKYCITIQAAKPLTDERLYSLLTDCSRETAGADLGRMWDIVFQYPEKTSSPLADKLVDFIFQYKGGILAPDRWDYYEPVRKRVDEHTIDVLKGELSKPRVIMLKRLKAPGVSFFIQNEEYHDLCPNVQMEYRFSGTDITIFLDARRKFVLEEWVTVLKDFCREMETDYGYIWDLDTIDVFAHVFSNPSPMLYGGDPTLALGKRRMFEALQIMQQTQHPVLGWYSWRFYPNHKTYCKDFIKMGLYALDLLKEWLLLKDCPDLFYGLRLNMDRTIKNTKRIRWDDPGIYWDSQLFMSHQDLLETFHYPNDSEEERITELSKSLSPLFSSFSRVYFKEKSNEVLLIP